jgi:hypothetical protein
LIILPLLGSQLGMNLNFVSYLISVATNAVIQTVLRLHERLTKIDELNGTIDQLRSANQKLGLENEVLVEMIAAPPVEGAMLVPGK